MGALEIWQLRGHEMLQPQDFTARTYGMGGVMFTARGAEAVFLNPAGMAVDVQGNVEMILTTRAYIMGRPPQYDDDVYEDYFGLNDFSCKIPFYSSYISNIGVYAPYQFEDTDINIAGGIAWRRYYDLGGKMIQKFEYQGDEQESRTSMSSSLNFLTFAGAICYQEKYAGGLAFGFPFMSNHNADSTFEVKSQDYEFKSSEEADISGSFFRLGIVARPTPIVMFSFMYTGAFELDSEDNEWEWEENWGGITSNGEGTSPDVELENPSFMALGVAFMPGDIVTLGIEYQNRPWEDYEADGSELVDDNGFSLRVGGDFDFGGVSLRAGYMMDKYWWVDEDSDLITIHTPTGGLGFGGKAFKVDFSLGYAMAGYDGAIGDVKYNLLITRLSLSYMLPLKFQ